MHCNKLKALYFFNFQSVDKNWKIFHFFLLFFNFGYINKIDLIGLAIYNHLIKWIKVDYYYFNLFLANFILNLIVFRLHKWFIHPLYFHVFRLCSVGEEKKRSHPVKTRQSRVQIRMRTWLNMAELVLWIALWTSFYPITTAYFNIRS